MGSGREGNGGRALIGAFSGLFFGLACGFVGGCAAVLSYDAEHGWVLARLPWKGALAGGAAGLLFGALGACCAADSERCSLRCLNACAAKFLYYVIRTVVGWLFGPLVCWWGYEPDPSKLLMTVHTNGMGHVKQAVALSDILGRVGIKIDTIAFGDLSKVPQSNIDEFKRHQPGVEILDFAHEIHYDDNHGASVSMVAVVLETAWKITVRNSARNSARDSAQCSDGAPVCPPSQGPPGLFMLRRFTKLLRQKRWGTCLSLWDPHVPLIMDSIMGGRKMKILAVATQGLLYLDWPHDLQLDFLYYANMGTRMGSELVSLLFFPQDDAMPVIVKVPEMAPKEDFLVAYSCMPACLTSISQITTKKVVLFTKNVDKWADYYRANKNIEVRPVGNEFAGYLSRCAGLVASPSPGVVTQALAIGRPCYLLCPPGHLEQQFNEDYYFKYFTGVTKPSMQGIGEWAASIKTTDDSLLPQAQKIRDWLLKFEEQTQKTAIPILRRMMAPTTGAYGELL